MSSDRGHAPQYCLSQLPLLISSSVLMPLPKKMHALCGNTAGVGICVLAVSQQHPEERYSFLGLFIMPGKVRPWNLSSLTPLPTPFPVIL